MSSAGSRLRLRASPCHPRTTRRAVPRESVAIQAIAFDKNPAANWKVAWHQDLMFPVAGPATASGYELPVIKDDAYYARPPSEVVQELLVVRERTVSVRC